ncbi:oligosaccharide flippase family protein [Roseibium sp. HPY-6]|uniref:oligosaccharide flippase family protein n=1 Tax=Roseibium sp. HPY-6 TaxID=3229852 RepID=UPI00338E822B
MLKQITFLFAGTGAATILPFVRNIFIARMISVEDFGIATTFALIFSFIEMITNVSHGRLIVQAEAGEGKVFQGSLQSIQLLRGFLNAIVIFACAQPLADFLQVSDAAWAFQVMALCPLLRGLSHFDLLRDQRNMKFSSTALATATPPLVSFATAFALTFVFDDYRIMLWAIIAHELTFTIASHVLSSRAYRLHWDIDVIKSAFSFGLPLLGSNILMFLNFQGDRLIVGNQLGPETLGWYSVAFLLIATPSLNVANTYQILTLPPLSRRQSQSKAFRYQADITLEGILFLSSLVVLGVSLVGPSILMLFFGARYDAAMTILVVFAVAQAVRLLRVGIVIVLISRARTDIVFYTSVVRVLALPCGYIALVNGYGIFTLLLFNILGEIAAVGFALSRSQKLRMINAKKHWKTLTVYSTFLGVCVIDSLIWPPSANLQDNIHPFQLVIVLWFLASVYLLRAGRLYLRENLLPELARKFFASRRHENGS